MRKRAKVLSLAIAIVVALTVIAGCASPTPTTTTQPTTTPPPQPTTPTPTQPTATTPAYAIHDPAVRFKIATTTSLYDTGLWYYLEPLFEEKYNVEMDILYAGTGIALEYGRRGDVDAVIVHDPAAEDKFIQEGYGINRRHFAFNYFLIAGPPSDPAGIKDMLPEDAFKKIYEGGMKNPDAVKFVSRGDNSGTHSKEKLIWKTAGFTYDTGILDSGPWYIEAGKGMGPTLIMANELQAYTLCDISTFLAFKGKNPDMELESLVEKGDIFLNIYAAMAINPEKVTTAKIEMANNLINWLLSAEVQKIIRAYGVAEYGRSLFHPISDATTMEGFPAINTSPAQYQK